MPLFLAGFMFGYLVCAVIADRARVNEDLIDLETYANSTKEKMK